MIIMSDFSKNIVEEQQTAKAGEMMTISKRVYLTKIGKSYRIGAVDALMTIGKTPSEIAEILKMNESSVRSIIEKNERYWATEGTGKHPWRNED